MKNLILVAVGVYLLIAGLPFGQRWTEQARVSVSFEFVVGSSVLPAGAYLVSTPDGNNTLIKLTNTETGAEIMATNIDVSGKNMYNENTNLVLVLDPSGPRYSCWLLPPVLPPAVASPIVSLVRDVQLPLLRVIEVGKRRRKWTGRGPFQIYVGR